MNTCRHCGRPVERGKYLPWRHVNGQARSSRAHYASPVRPTLRAAAAHPAPARSAARSWDLLPPSAGGRTHAGTVKPMPATRAAPRRSAVER